MVVTITFMFSGIAEQQWELCLVRGVAPKNRECIIFVLLPVSLAGTAIVNSKVHTSTRVNRIAFVLCILLC